MRRRVVITGMGTVNPVGNNVSDFWDGIKAGKSGIGPITKFDVSKYATRIAGEVKNFDITHYLDPKEARKMETFSYFTVASSLQAWKQAGMDKDSVDPERMGVVLGVGMGGFETIESAFISLQEKGPSRVHPMTVPKLIANIGPANVAMMLNAQGPCYALATACASGTDAIGNAARLIMDDICDVMVTGGVEAIITTLGIAAFNAIHAMSTKYNDTPTLASRPFEKNRDGFVLGEGAGILILEEYEHAKKRGANILVELVGVGVSNDAYHLTAPHPEGRGAALAMRSALRMAKLEPSDIQYINAHGTSTEINDAVETKAVKMVFGEHAYKLAMSSTKSMTGHLIGAAGAIEAIISAMSIVDQYIPPTINYEVPDPELDLDYVPNKGRKAHVQHVMSNSLGFGGHNGVLIFKKSE